MTRGIIAGQKVRWIVSVAIALAVGACASSSRSAGEPRSNRDSLVPAQLGQEYQFESAHAVIERLRPHWFESRRTGSRALPDSLGGGLGGREQIHLYVNGTRMGAGVEMLRGYLIRDLRSLEYLRPTDASIRFGWDHGAGAILIQTIAGQ